MDLGLTFDSIKSRKRSQWRSRRMRAFLALVRPQEGARVLDVGGNPDLWELFDHRLDVTLFNTGEAQSWGFRPPRRQDRFRVVTGDACDLGRFGNGSFDVVFSNSLIEHLGGDGPVGCFAREVSRVGKAYWVQTPSWLFPIEPHTGLPFYWFYPLVVRRGIAHWLDRRYAGNPWSCAVADTRCFTLAELRTLFPDASLFTERVAGFTKSWSLYRAAGAWSCA